MESFKYKQYVIFHEIDWKKAFIKCMITDLKKVWAQEIKGQENLQKQCEEQFPQFCSSSGAENIVSKILKNLISKPSSIELNLSDTISIQSDHDRNQNMILPSLTNPGISLCFHGKIDIISIKWKFECCQLIPDAAADFIRQYLIIPMASINQIMCDRETKILETVHVYKEQVRLIEQLYKVELKREAVKMLNIDFDEDKFVQWKEIDWRKRIELSRSTDGLPNSDTLLERITSFVREKQVLENHEIEMEELKRRKEVFTPVVVSSSAPVPDTNSEAPSKIEQERLRRLKREADLAKAKEKKKIKKLF